MPRDVLSIWTVYAYPKDYPNSFVARRWEVWKGRYAPTRNTIVADTLRSLQQELEDRGLTRLDRAAQDDPVIIESWI